MKAKILSISIGLLIGCGVIGSYVWRQEHRPAIFEAYVFNVKSGRSVFIRTPDDKRILIDGGGTSEVIRHITKVLPFYSRRIDTIIATSEEGKNVSGLIDVLERYNVGRVFVPGLTLEKLGLASSTDKIYLTFLETLKKKSIASVELIAGDSIELGAESNAQVLFPASEDIFEYSKASRPEVLLKIDHKNTSLLLAGSATTKVQKSIASSTASLKSEVLFVPHSASPDSFAEEFIKKIKPTHLIFSKTITKEASSKKKSDPLFFVLNNKRFNLKERGTTKIASDEATFTITQ